jgi:competence protein ComEC
MRLVAWAAAIVLLLWPDSLIGPSFQLSFAAIIALIAMWEEIAPGRRPESSPWRRGLIGTRDMVLTSLIATLATAAFGIYHFNRFTGYGVVANMLAVPITGFWVMPFLILSLLLMPFGLESLALMPAGWGIEAILWTARTVAGWPGAVSVVRAMPPLGIALVSVGGLWLCPGNIRHCPQPSGKSLSYNIFLVRSQRHCSLAFAISHGYGGGTSLGR